MTIGDGDVPKLGAVDDTVSPVGLLALVAALALGGAAVAAHPDRRHAIVLVGRRLLFLGVGPIVVFVVVPILLDAAGNDVAGTFAAVMRVYGERVLASAVALVVAGAAVWCVAGVLRRSHRADITPAALG
jgi:hypothetical protein